MIGVSDLIDLLSSFPFFLSFSDIITDYYRSYQITCRRMTAVREKFQFTRNCKGWEFRAMYHFVGSFNKIYSMYLQILLRKKKEIKMFTLDVFYQWLHALVRNMIKSPKLDW